LSPIDLDLYIKAGWILEKHFHVGSLAADYTRKRLIAASVPNSVSLENDILVIANSTNFRISQCKIAELLLNFGKDYPSLRIAVALKRQPKDADYETHVSELKSLYGESITMYDNVDHNSFRLALRSKVVIGSYTTVLREVLSSGIMVYAINFDDPAVDEYFSSSSLNPRPCQSEFNFTLKNLLATSDNPSAFFPPNFRDYLGCLPDNPGPSERLQALVCNVLTTNVRSRKVI
jgi:hypothetical protein